MPTAACLDAGFFVGGEDEFTVFQGCPSHTLSYKSRIRPAFSAKWGSRGKTQQRCCQGRMASSWSQRQTVVLLMLATNPDWRTWAARSALIHREMGNPKVAGNSQAKALTSTTTSGGKRPGGDPAESSPPDPSGVFRKSAFARNIPPLDGYPNVSRSHHYANPGLPGESSWLAVPEKYGNVYFRARANSSLSSPGDRTILYGLCRGTVELLSGYHNAKSA